MHLRLSDMTQNNTKWVRLGDYIRQHTANNRDLQYGIDLIEGVNSSGEFCSAKGNTDGVNLKPYKIVQDGYFVYNPSRLNIGSLAYRTTGLCIVSHLYILFSLNELGEKYFIPEFLLMYFKRKEFLREVTYLNYGSQRPEFNFKDISEISVPRPSINEQEKAVNAWKHLIKVKEQNEAMAAPLMQLCQSRLQELKRKYPATDIGPYISRVDRRNTDNSVKVVKSVSVKKEFNDTNAKVDKNNLGSYKIVEDGQISFVQTTGNEKCLCAAVNHFGYPIVVTSVNEVFETDGRHLLVDYLHLYFRRREFDRYARFHSWGSARETFNWDDMCRVAIPIPPIEEQQAIVNIYKCAAECKRIAEEADKLSREICPALIQKVIHA